METTERRKKLSRDNPTTAFDEDKIEMGDDYDIIRETITVNSPISTLNPDFIMGDLDPVLLQNPVVEYIRENLIIIEHINLYLNEKGDEEYKTKCNQLLLNKIYSLANLSRSHDGKVIKAILDRIRTGAGQQINQPLQPEETEKEKSAPMGILNPANWGNKKR